MGCLQFSFCFSSLLAMFVKYMPLSNRVLPLLKQLMIFFVLCHLRTKACHKRQGCAIGGKYVPQEANLCCGRRTWSHRRQICEVGRDYVS